MSEAKRMTDERLASFRRRCADGPGNPDHYAIPILEVRDLIAEIDALTAERDAIREDRDSWRRVSESYEQERLGAKAQLREAREALRNVALHDGPGYPQGTCCKIAEAFLSRFQPHDP